MPHRTSSGWDPPKSSSHRTEVQILVPTPHLHFGAITGQQRCWPRVCVSATNAGSDSWPREGGSSDHSTALWTNNAENSSPQGQALLTLPDRLCEVGSNKIGPDRSVGNQRRQFELARQQRASQSPSSLLRRQRCFRREIAQRREGVGLFSGAVALRRASPRRHLERRSDCVCRCNFPVSPNRLTVAGISTLIWVSCEPSRRATFGAPHEQPCHV